MIQRKQRIPMRDLSTMAAEDRTIVEKNAMNGRVFNIFKVLGMVNAAPDFREHPKVINGFSDLMVEVFGEAGRGARAAVGMASLSGQMAVEIEMVIELKS